MKKYLTLFILFVTVGGIAQCAAPTNLTITNDEITQVQLNWTENGTATAWEVTVLPDFGTGTPLPTTGFVAASTNPFILTGLPPGCKVFFVRSYCSPTDVSPWAINATWDCSFNVFAYIATLSNEGFLLDSDNNELKIYPNPTKDILNIATKDNAAISSITLYNLLGQVVLVSTNPNKITDVSGLKAGSYFIKIVSDKGVTSAKFIKE